MVASHLAPATAPILSSYRAQKTDNRRDSRDRRKEGTDKEVDQGPNKLITFPRPVPQAQVFLGKSYQSHCQVSSR